MDRQTLARLVSDKARIVEVDGHSYELRPPHPKDVAGVFAQLPTEDGDEANVDAMAATMIAAVCATLDLGGEPCSPDDAASVLSVTGHLGSPVGRAALTLCGWSFDRDPDERETDANF